MKLETLATVARMLGSRHYRMTTVPLFIVPLFRNTFFANTTE